MILRETPLLFKTASGYKIDKSIIEKVTSPEWNGDPQSELKIIGMSINQIFHSDLFPPIPYSRTKKIKKKKNYESSG